jgi:hypothetical protein
LKPKVKYQVCPTQHLNPGINVLDPTDSCNISNMPNVPALSAGLFWAEWMHTWGTSANQLSATSRSCLTAEIVTMLSSPGYFHCVGSTVEYSRFETYIAASICTSPGFIKPVNVQRSFHYYDFTHCCYLFHVTECRSVVEQKF